MRPGRNGRWWSFQGFCTPIPTDQGADVPEIAAWDEAATRQSYALTHQFLADAFAARL